MRSTRYDHINYKDKCMVGKVKELLERVADWLGRYVPEPSREPVPIPVPVEAPRHARRTR